MVVVAQAKKYLAMFVCAGLLPLCAQAQNMTGWLLEMHQKALGANCQTCHVKHFP